MPEVRLEVAGKRGISAFRFRKIQPDESFTHFEDKPSFAEVDVLASRYLADFTHGGLDRLDVAYTKFESASRQQAVVETLLPLGGLEERATRRNCRQASRSTSSCPRPRAFWTRSCRRASKSGCSSVFSTRP